MADAATSLTPGFQRLNTATPALSASPGGGGGRRGTKGRGAAAAAAAGSRATAANAMVLETPPVSSSSSSLNGSGAPPRLRPEALARKLRRLAAEALDKVGKEETPTDTYRRVEPSHLTSPFPLPNPNRRIHQRLHARAAFYADKLVTLGQSAAVPAPAPTPQGAAERKDQQQQPLLPLSQHESIVETDADGKQTIVQENLTMGEISLLRSADAGASWDVVHSQSYNGSYQPSTSNVAFQGANTVVWATHDRVHWSDDNGSSWRLIDGIPGLTTIVGSVAFDTAGALWAATSEGLFKANAVNVSVDEGNIDEVHDPRSHSTPIFWANTFPNPTDRTFTLRLYNLDRLRGDVEQFEIVDLLGRTVLDLSYLTQGQRPQGTIDVPLDLGVNASGLYLLVARTAQRSFTWPMWVYRE